jgi:hypothetical protein
MLGGSLLELKELLGQASLDMVLRYAHPTPSKLQGAVQILDRTEKNGLAHKETADREWRRRGQRFR